MCSGDVVARIQMFLLHGSKSSGSLNPRKERSLLTLVSPLSNLCGTAERAQKEAAEKEQELLRQKQKELQQVMEAQERSYKENVAQLHEKMETERKNILREQEEKLEHKLKVRLSRSPNFSEVPSSGFSNISQSSEWYRGTPGCFESSLIIQESGKFINEHFWGER